MSRERVLIMGAGPAGYTAAIYAARANLAPLVVTGIQPGGQLSITTEVENFPGFETAIQGPDLMERMRKQADNVGARIVSDYIVDVDLSQRPFRMKGDSGEVYETETLIVSTGAQARWLELQSEEFFRGFGVSACATCDGFFYRGREVVVVGGGNTALEEALYLTNHAQRVILVHRGSSFRGEAVLQDRVANNPAIEVVWRHVVDEIVGDTAPVRSVTGVRLRHVETGETRALVAHGVFIAIGHVPSSELFKGKLDMDKSGYIRIAPWSTATSVDGVFSCGDVSDPVYRQAVTAAGMGCMAALEAQRFLAQISR